jgi:hypothetical protein
MQTSMEQTAQCELHYVLFCTSVNLQKRQMVQNRHTQSDKLNLFKAQKIMYCISH